MTRQTIEDLYDDGRRLEDEIVEAMREYGERTADDASPWCVEYEIPAETNGWVYVGNPGAVSVTHQWADQWPNPTEAVVLHETPTHPRDESRTKVDVYHLDNYDDKTKDPDSVFATIEGEEYRTPLYVRRRMFWEATEAAIGWMNDHPRE